jgi:hypothetical protein
MPIPIAVCCSIEYNVSYIYHAMWAYFDRDNVGLPGLAAYFKESSLEERGHAEMLMEYNVRRLLRKSYDLALLQRGMMMREDVHA